ncbi:PH domain-containing protein [Halobacillus sp. A1]|uniref:PH domain-containing protein n=1 Tax=Halobacillus sp. A1 TaxID=2880262 RepID=UPI0020A6AE90|nr:PH domain-containing protein [Halobacillus sp. A1]MCP3032401.1 PH domain-containing protein [Halobacillus sp. A1]
MFEPKRLHPISALINFIKGLKDAILPLIAVLFLNNNQQDGWLGSMPLLISGSLLLVILTAGIIKWLRFSYWIEEGELRIEHGLFVKKKRYIPIDRIQSLDFSEGIFHRPFQLVKVKVETAGSSDALEAEAELTAIHKKEADHIQLVIDERKKEKFSENEYEAVDRKLVYQMELKDIIIMALTSGGAGVVISGVLVFLSQGMEFLPVDAIYDEVISWLQVGLLVVAAAILFVLFIAYGISVILTIFRYSNFSVYIDNGDIIMTRGLLEKKQVTIPLNRIQGVRVDENPIRQPLGYATVTIISAGGSVNDSDQTLTILPLIKRKQITDVLRRIIDDYEWDLPANRVPKRSLFRYILRFIWLPAVIAGVVSYYLFPFGLLAWILVPAASIFGYLSFKDAGWNINGNQLTLIRRILVKQTYVMKKHRIQAVTKDQTIFQKRARLASIEATLKSGAGGASARLWYLEEKDTDIVMSWYRYKDSYNNGSLD